MIFFGKKYFYRIKDFVTQKTSADRKAAFRADEKAHHLQKMPPVTRRHFLGIRTEFMKKRNSRFKLFCTLGICALLCRTEPSAYNDKEQAARQRKAAWKRHRFGWRRNPAPPKQHEAAFSQLRNRTKPHSHRDGENTATKSQEAATLCRHKQKISVHFCTDILRGKQEFSCTVILLHCRYPCWQNHFLSAPLCSCISQRQYRRTYTLTMAPRRR